MSDFVSQSSWLQHISSPFAGWVLRRLGWTIIGGRIPCPKAVLTAVPHTTNWDLFYTLLGACALRIPIWFMMKNNHFWFPASILWKVLGGVPVDRDKPGGMVGQMVDAFSSRERLYLVIPPDTGGPSRTAALPTGARFAANVSFSRII